jgi:hypothetical protein
MSFRVGLAAATAGAAARRRLYFYRELADAGPAGQFGAARVAASQRQLTVYQDQRQPFLPAALPGKP